MTALESLMQKTREQILHILKMRGAATVEELSEELGLTPVTIRHHLDVLNREGLISPPEPLRKPGPGRPQYLYRLAEAASHLFPKHYDLLAVELLSEVADTVSSEEMDTMLDRIAQRMAARAGISPDSDPAERLRATVAFLNESGYMASTGQDDAGRVLLHVANCPYERVARNRLEPCALDEKVLTLLLGYEPERIASSVSSRGNRCTYVVKGTSDDKN